MKKFTLIWNEDSFSLYFSGEINLIDLMAANDELVASHKLDDVTHYYVDFCNVELLNVSESEMKIYAKYDSVMQRYMKHQSLRGAYRVPNRLMKKQLSKFIEHGHKAWPRKLFISCIIAETWIHDGISLQKLVNYSKQKTLNAIA